MSRKTPTWIQVPPRALLAALELVTFAAARDEARPVLSAVLFEISRKRGRPATMKVVACDNYRIAWADVDRGEATESGKVESFLLRLSDATHLQVTLAAWLKTQPFAAMPVLFAPTETIGDVPTEMSISVGATTFKVTLMRETYPNWKAVIPQGRMKHTVVIDGHLLAEIAKAITVKRPKGRELPASASIVIELPANPLHPLRISTFNADDHGVTLMPVRGNVPR